MAIVNKQIWNSSAQLSNVGLACWSYFPFALKQILSLKLCPVDLYTMLSNDSFLGGDVNDVINYPK